MRPMGAVELVAALLSITMEVTLSLDHSRVMAESVRQNGVEQEQFI